MSDQDQRDGGYFVVRDGMAVDVWHHLGFALDETQADRVTSMLAELAAGAGGRSRAENAETALCSNRGPTSRPIDIRMPAVARREDEIDTLTV